jgi:ABC-type uncharacterized transport system substrate-binding protein
LIVVYSCVLCSAGAANAASFEKKKVLVLNSYHSGYKGSDDILNGFRNVLVKSLPDTELHVEYLDSKNFSGVEFDRKIVELLLFKYQQHHFDLIFSTDDYAFDFLEKYRDRIFHNTPVVFCGTNSFDRSRLTGQKGMVGVDERPSFADTLELILKIHPATTNVVVIHDNSVTGQLNVREFRQASAGFEKHTKFTYLAGLRLEELVSRVALLQPGSVIMYFASYVENSAGERISSGDALQAIRAISKVPIYGGWEFNLGRGIVGGRLVNLSDHGALSATLAIRLLNGESAAALTPLMPSPNSYMFDYAELSRFGITEKLLPAGSVIINKPPGFLWAYRVTILVLLSVVLFAALVVIFVVLLKSRKDLKRHRDELARRNDELETALANVRQLEGIIPICMYCKNIRDDKESWLQLETYISKHSDAWFSHGICPACEDKAREQLQL